MCIYNKFGRSCFQYVVLFMSHCLCETLYLVPCGDFLSACLTVIVSHILCKTDSNVDRVHGVQEGLIPHVEATNGTGFYGVQTGGAEQAAVHHAVPVERSCVLACHHPTAQGVASLLLPQCDSCPWLQSVVTAYMDHGCWIVGLHSH